MRRLGSLLCLIAALGTSSCIVRSHAPSRPIDLASCIAVLDEAGVPREAVASIPMTMPTLGVCGRIGAVGNPLRDDQVPRAPESLWALEDARLAQVDTATAPRVCAGCDDAQTAGFWYVRALSLRTAWHALDALQRAAMSSPPDEDRTHGLMRLPYYLASRAYDDAFRCTQEFEGIPQPLRDACVDLRSEMEGALRAMATYLDRAPAPTRPACGYEPLVVPGRAVQPEAGSSHDAPAWWVDAEDAGDGPPDAPIWLVLERDDAMRGFLFADEARLLRAEVARQLRLAGDVVVDDDESDQRETGETCGAAWERSCCAPMTASRPHREARLDVNCRHATGDRPRLTCTLTLHGDVASREVSIPDVHAVSDLLDAVPSLLRTQPPRRFGTLGTYGSGPSPVLPVHTIVRSWGYHGGNRARMRPSDFEVFLDGAHDALFACAARHSFESVRALFEFGDDGRVVRLEAAAGPSAPGATVAARSCAERALAGVGRVAALAGGRYHASLHIKTGDLRTVELARHRGARRDGVAIHWVRRVDAAHASPVLDRRRLDPIVARCVRRHAPTYGELPITFEGTTTVCGPMADFALRTPVPAVTQCIARGLELESDPCTPAAGSFRLDLCARTVW